MINSITFGDYYKAYSMRWTSGASFGGTFALEMYHLHDPNTSKKIVTFGPKLMMSSTCHLASSLQKTAYIRASDIFQVR